LAYETILVIVSADKDPNTVVVNKTIQQVINKIITKVKREVNNNNNNNIDIIIKDRPTAKPKADGSKLPDYCLFYPDIGGCEPKGESCSSDYGKNENGNCYPRIERPSGFWRADEDESGACVPKPKEQPKPLVPTAEQSIDLS